jgi:parallel beta-helix repeat protein/predicted outer membrane repeat protein
MDDNDLSKLIYCKLLYGKATEGTNVYDDTGGAVFMNDFSNVMISNCIISNNSASGEGGGIYCRYSNPVIVSSVICNNTASGSGGGIYCAYSNPILINNTIVHNSASSGGGICLLGDSDPELINTILWGNIADSAENQVALLQKTCDPYLSYCNVQGGTASFTGWGAGSKYDTTRYQNNIDADPLFVSPSGGVGKDYDGLSGNWGFQINSHCINNGIPDITGLSNLPSDDLAGNPRINSNVIDIGAYEYQLSEP